MHGILGAYGPAQHFNGAVGDDLIGVHIRLRARARLPDNQREMIVKLTRDHFGGGLHNRIAQRLVELALRHVHGCSRLFDDTQSADDSDGLFLPADGEVHQAALGLRAPILVGGHVQGAKAV